MSVRPPINLDQAHTVGAVELCTGTSIAVRITHVFGKPRHKQYWRTLSETLRPHISSLHLVQGLDKLPHVRYSTRSLVCMQVYGTDGEIFGMLSEALETEWAAAAHILILSAYGDDRDHPDCSADKRWFDFGGRTLVEKLEMARAFFIQDCSAMGVRLVPREAISALIAGEQSSHTIEFPARVDAYHCTNGERLGDDMS